MNDLEGKRISSGSKVFFLVVVYILTALVPFLIYKVYIQNFEDLHIITILSTLTFFIVILYLFTIVIKMAIVEVQDQKISFKKPFQKKKIYNFNQIGYTSTFNLRRRKFTSVRMKNLEGKSDPYIVMNNNALLSFERFDAEIALKHLRKIGNQNS